METQQLVCFILENEKLSCSLVPRCAFSVEYPGGPELLFLLVATGGRLRDVHDTRGCYGALWEPYTVDVGPGGESAGRIGQYLCGVPGLVPLGVGCLATIMLLQPFSQKSHTPTLPKELECGIFGRTAVDVDGFEPTQTWSASLHRRQVLLARMAAQCATKIRPHLE